MNYDFDDLWDRLNRSEIAPIPAPILHADASADFQRAFDHFKERPQHRVVNVRQKDDLLFLAKCGISHKYLAANLSKTVNGRYYDALAFQSIALKEKAVYARCPFTGARVASRHSLLANMNAIFYRFQGGNDEIFYLAIANIGSGFKKSGLYFPSHELIVTTGDRWGLAEDDVIELKARMACNFTICHRYLTNPDYRDRKTAICFGYYHFAHHFWNELSGLSRITRKRLLPAIDKFLVMREPLGPIEQLFPEISSERIQRYEDTGRIFNEIVAHNYFVIKVGDESIPKRLAERVYRVALRNCHAETIARVRDAKERHHPLLWIGIRVGTRSWTDQADGMARLIHALHCEYPRLGVVFDGFSLPADTSEHPGSDGEYADILRQENAVVKAIVDRLHDRRHSGLGVFNIIGSSIYDANVWAHAIDVYVSPHGTIQHKVGWLARKPGVVHTNRTAFEDASKYIWAVVEAGIKPRYIAGATPAGGGERESREVLYRKVSDLKEIGAGLKEGVRKAEETSEFDNYEIDWHAIHDNLQRIIAAPRLRHRIDPSVWLERTKREAKRTLRNVTRTLDYSKI